jgi:periplasmic protein CpxP/Spy
MTTSIRRLALAATAGIVALGITAGLYAATQTQNTSQDPRPFSGRGRGPGGLGPQDGRGPGGPMSFLPMLGRLQLTDAQRDQIKAIVDSHRDEWKQLADRARAAHRALNEAVTADAVDEALIRQKSADVAAVDADVAVARAHAHAEVSQLLTAEQKNQLKAMRTQARARMHQMAERMRERLGL